MSDIAHLLQIISRIVDAGNTMIVIEHNLDVIRNARLDCRHGTGGRLQGRDGPVQGTPRDLLTARNSLTAQYLS